MSSNTIQLVDLLKAFSPPLIALIAAFIAYQQWKTNKFKLNLDRYDRRLKIYKDVVRFLSIIHRDAKINDQELFAFRQDIFEADFLFGPEIPKFIIEIYQHSVDLHRWNTEYRNSNQDKPEGYDHKMVCDEMHKELTWLTNQFEPAKKIFNKYLNISKQ